MLNPHYGKPYHDSFTRMYLRELPRKLKQILFGLFFFFFFFIDLFIFALQTYIKCLQY